MTQLVDDSLEELVRRVARTTQLAPANRQLNPGARLAGRFDLAEKLGTGGMGQVFAAFDEVRQARVALKVLGRLTPRSILQVKREFRAAAGLVHPNLVRLHELFSDGVEWFFTMALVDGGPLSELGLDPRSAALRDVFWQLACGLRALHRGGSVHADLKPSNFLVTHGERRVVLLDFGVARPIGLHQAADGGTPLYMAPEQARGEVLTEAADWYSFGLVLHQVLVGELPARAPLDAIDHVSSDLGRLCRALLRERQEERPRGDEVVAVLGSGLERVSAAAHVPSAAGDLIGRGRELAELQRAMEQSVSGRPATVLVNGASGIGKTALVQAFAAEVRARGGVVLAGACRERESMSYKAVDGLIDGIVAVLDELPRSEARELLPPDIDDLTVLFPALRTARVVGDASRAQVNTSQELGLVRHRAITAFEELLANLRRRGPLLLWVDDLQWADRESALLLRPLLAGGDRVPLLFVGGHRSGASGRGPLIDAIFGEEPATCQPTEIVVGPLDVEQSARLALAHLGSDHDAAVAAQEIGREAGGHPLFIAELAHDRGEGQPNDASATPPTLFDLVARRVGALPSDARGVLEATAVAGLPISRGALRQALGLEIANTEEALDVLKAARLTSTRGLKEGDEIDIHHDRIREIILDGLSPESRKWHHAKLAAALEARLESTPEVIATHHQAAGEQARAGHHWLIAADLAVRALAFDYAVELYDKGLAAADLAESARREVGVCRAVALGDAGKGPRAAEAFLEAAQGAQRDDAVELTRRAAEQLLLSGHLSRGLAVMEDVLRSIGLRRPRSGRAALVSFVIGRALLRVRGLRYTTKIDTSLSRHELSRLDASWTIARSLGMIDPLRGAEFQTKHLRLALDAGEPRRLLRALTLEIPYSATVGAGDERRTQELLELAGALLRELGDHGARGFFHLARGVAEYLYGRFASSLADLERAIEIFTQHCPGAVWETVTAQRFVIASLFALGRMRQLAHLVPKLLAQAEGQGNLYATMSFCAAYSWAAWLARDDVAGAKALIERARKDWEGRSYHNSHCNILIGDSYVDLYAGDAERALERLRDQWPKAKGAQLLRVGALRVVLTLLRGGAAAAAAHRASNEGEVARARSFGFEARQMIASLRKERIARAPLFASLIEAALELQAGRPASARRLLRTCIEGFDREGMRLMAAAARARLADLLEGGESDELRANASRTLDEEGVVDPARILDMLAPGFRAPG